jgi:ornithine decarboxylase
LVFCRILTDGEGAEWPLSRKFGCVPQMAVDVLVYAHQLGLVSHGVSFHVGSQQTDLTAWDRALEDSKRVFDKLLQQGIRLGLVNMGGGFPTRYLRDVPTAQSYGRAIGDALRHHFGNDIPRTIIEPGRGMVGNAGVLKTEVVLVSRKSDDDDKRWVFLDVGKFGGLAETMDEAIRYSLLTERDADEKAPCIVAGPTCDSADVLYERTPYNLPVSLTVGDEILIEGTGAYTTTYSAVAFNGFEPLRAYVI